MEEQQSLGINYVAIMVATVANFIFGFLWYTPLFGKAWAKEMGIAVDRKPTGGEMAKGLSLMVIGNFLMAYVFAHNNAAWSFVPGMNLETIGAAATIGQAAVFTWLGFYVPTDLSVVAWEGKSWKLFFINAGYHLFMLVIAATILVMMPA
jgi:hypothetical protein